MLVPVITLAIAAPPGQHCADEGGLCTGNTPRTVFYGANGTYVSQRASGDLPCNNRVFGDPVVGVRKACYVVPLRAPGPPVCEAGERCDLTGVFQADDVELDLVATRKGVQVWRDGALVYDLQRMNAYVAKQAFEGEYVAAWPPEAVDLDNAYFTQKDGARLYCRVTESVVCTLATDRGVFRGLASTKPVSEDRLVQARRTGAMLTVDTAAQSAARPSPKPTPPSPKPASPPKPSAPAPPPGLPEEVTRLYTMQSCWFVPTKGREQWLALVVEGDHLKLRYIRNGRWELEDLELAHQPDLYYAGSKPDADVFTGGRVAVQFARDGETGTVQLGGRGVEALVRFPAAGKVPAAFTMTGRQCDAVMDEALGIQRP